MRARAGVWPGNNPRFGIFGEFVNTAFTWWGMQDGSFHGMLLLGFIPNNPEQAFSSHHVGGAHFLLGDGAVRFVNENIQQLLTPLDNAALAATGMPASWATAVGFTVGPLTAQNMGVYNKLGNRSDGFPVGDY
jgi:hypothetical protein